MSNIRLIGIALGIATLSFAFVYFRGPRWHKFNFVLAFLIGGALLIVAVEPDSANAIRDILNVGDFEYGRLLAVLVISNIATLLIALYAKSRADTVKTLVDRLACASAVDAVAPQDLVTERVKDLMVVIPALNEMENLGILLPKIPRQISGRELGVLVVDDGSTDGTRQITLDSGYLCARSPVSRGQGAALRIGYRFLIEHGVRIGVTMDADNQHRPEDIARLVEPIITGKQDLVIGSRILGSADRDSWFRYFGVRVLSPLVSLIMGTRVTDCSSGFKAFDVRKFGAVDLREDQFQTSEVLIMARKRGLRVGEQPIHIRRRVEGISRKGPNFTYGLFFLRTMARTWWR